MSKIAFTCKGTRLSGCFLIRKGMPKLLPQIHFTAVFRLDCQPLVKIECWGPDLETNLFWYCFGKSISVLEELSQAAQPAPCTRLATAAASRPLTVLCIALKPKSGLLGKPGLWCLKIIDFCWWCCSSGFWASLVECVPALGGLWVSFPAQMVPCFYDF